MNGQDQLLNEIIKQRTALRDIFLRHYFEKELFSFSWWIAVALLIIPLIIWWKLVDRKRLLEICFFGYFTNMTASLLDVLGTSYVFWEYPVHVIPQIALLTPIDYVVVPVIGMLIYQRFSKWDTFIIVSLAASAVMAFACEPFAVYLNLYRLIKWKFIYSYPIYALIYISAKIVTGYFVKKIACKK